MQKVTGAQTIVRNKSDCDCEISFEYKSMINYSQSIPTEYSRWRYYLLDMATRKQKKLFIHFTYRIVI